MSKVHADDAKAAQVKFHTETKKIEIQFSIESKDLDRVGDTVFLGYIETIGENGRSRYLIRDTLRGAALGAWIPRYQVENGSNLISVAVGNFSSSDFFEELPSGKRVRRVASRVELSEAVSSADTKLIVQLISTKDAREKIMIYFEKVRVIGDVDR
jgi:hypothetical protein